MPKGVYTRKTNPIVNLEPRVPRPWQERFWSKVPNRPEVGCWLWAGSTDRKGYGKLRIGGAGTRVVAAPRLAWEIEHGAPPTRYVLHHCDTPLCVRPSHLFEGGARENAEDMVAKGRQAQGSGHPSAKLTEAQVVELRRLHDAGHLRLSAKLAATYGVSYVALWHAVTRRTWRHVD